MATGNYHIKIEFISFKTILLENKSLDKDIDLGNLPLQTDIKLLKAVDVIGEKSSVSLDLDKKTFNVGKDLVSKGGNANDILNNVPSVNVDANGAISLRGNSGVRVLINGKPSMISANNGLEQIPASSIEKVEVITNPSARYEAQGGAGIINIVLKKNSLAGLNASVQVGAGDPTNYNGNVNLSFKTEKFNLFSNVGVRFRNLYLKEERLQTTLNNGEKVCCDKTISTTDVMMPTTFTLVAITISMPKIHLREVFITAHSSLTIKLIITIITLMATIPTTVLYIVLNIIRSLKNTTNLS